MIFDKDTDLMKLIEQAENGDEKALRLMATYLTLGRVLDNPILDELAEKYINILASNDDAKGLIMKADILLNQNSDKATAIEAIKLYLRALLEGEEFAIECIADMFFQGKCVDQDREIAFLILWYVIQQSKDVNSLCLYEIGKIAQEGEVIMQDLDLARFCYEKCIVAAGEYSELDEFALKARKELDDLNSETD
ncbi:hypothetical protein SAMN02910377_00657 [Pseudobutyrivibrio ruminis]|uniref:Sel1 repeat family protein n=1 Tax=Pseudobutyrivibrio ruminis TaxID=46206 RepID=A0A1H7G7K9_9FIRM|nr:hypothetical protein [Pseudobutyrivibrio ruminis]SEK34121.1 hypothetical protein SAMN02910377_00657 [Pseudobutyrivibrio ruminis]